MVGIHPNPVPAFEFSEIVVNAWLGQVEVVRDLPLSRGCVVLKPVVENVEIDLPPPFISGEVASHITPISFNASS